jgi:hypothetical protein
MSSSTISKNAQLYSTYDDRTVPDSQVYPLLYNADLWVDASDTSTFTLTGTGDKQTLSGNWLDKSKNANNLVPTAVGIYYDVGNKGFVLNGQYFMPSSSLPTVNSRCIFLVVGFWGSVNSGSQYILGFNPSNGAGQHFFRIETAGLLSLNNSTNVLVGASPILEGKRYLLGFNNNNGFLNHFINGKLDGSATGTTFSSTNPSAFFGSATANTTLRGVVHECIYFSSALSTNQRQLIEYYLMTKWKLPANTIANPTSVSGCRLWLDASDATTITAFGGTIVTGWADKSGFSNHATGMSSYQPGYSAGTPAITFNTTQGMTTPYVPAAAGETMFVVLKTTTISSVASQYFIDSSNVSSGRNFRITGTGNTRIYVSGGGSNALLGLIGITAQTFTTHFLYCATFSSAGINQFISKVRDTLSTGSFVPTAGTYTQIGSRNTPPATGLNGSISEIVAYNLVLSASDRELVSNYLMNKWDIPCISGRLVNTYNGFQRIAPRMRYFSPNDIDDCVVWIDAADKATVTTSGSNVTGLTNKADTMAITTYGTPTWSATGLNNLPAIDLTNGRFIGPFSTVPGSTMVRYRNTCFIVGSMTTLPADGSALLAFAQAATGSAVFYRVLDYATSTFRTVSFFAAVTASSQTSVTNTPFIWTSSYRSDGNSFPLATSINGGGLVNTNVATQPTTTPTHFMIGTDGFTGGTTVNTWPGKVCEIIIFSRLIGLAESQQIEGYLANKWGLRSNLPALHTLKDIDPLSSPFNPRSIPTCTFWYDIADVSTLTYASGSTVNVTAVKDKSGYGFNLLRDVYTAGRELTTANKLNGLSTLTFPGDPAGNNATLTYLRSTTVLPFNSASNYVFFVMRFNPYVLEGTSTARSWAFIYPFNIGVVNGAQGGMARNGTNWTLQYGISNVGTGALGTTVISTSSSGPSVGLPFVGMFGKTAAAQYVFSYNGLYETKAGTSATVAGGQPLNIGIFYQAQELCEIIYYTGKVLSVQEIAKIDGYLAWKWGLQGNLPATHIYKKAPP